jgi:hypothetical protein
MQLLDVARRKMLHQQHLLKEAELHRLDDEIRRKVYPFIYQNIIFINFI